MVTLRGHNEIPYLCSPLLERLGGVCHGFSTRLGGASEGPYASLNLSFRVGDDEGRVEENRRRFFGIFSIDPRQVVTVRQVHGFHVTAIESPDGEDRPWHRLEADALVTDVPGVALAVLTADCMPVLLVDPHRPVVATVHAGRVGLARGVVSSTVEAMVTRYGSSPRDLLVAFGPHVRQCCYTLPEELVKPFRGLEGAGGSIVTERGRGKWALALCEAARREIESLGVPRGQIDVSHDCTACGRDVFYSYRAEGRTTGRLLSFTLLAPGEGKR
jgi:YfiH family protein